MGRKLEPEQYNEILYLHVYEHLNQWEIAEKVGCCEKTVGRFLRKNGYNSNDSGRKDRIEGDFLNNHIEEKEELRTSAVVVANRVFHFHSMDGKREYIADQRKKQVTASVGENVVEIKFEDLECIADELKSILYEIQNK